MAEFSMAYLGDLAKKEKGAISIGPFGSRMKADTYVCSGVPVVRGTNISGDRELKGDWVYVPEAFAAEMPNCIVQAGDLVFPHRGSIGDVALIEAHQAPMVLSSSMMKFRPAPERLDGRFAYYFFKSRVGRAEILRFGSQVGTPGIGQPLSSLRQFRLPLPDIKIQAEIAGVLSALDDKIKINRRMIETLEALTQAIYRDWFVDFGPVRRKQGGVVDPIEIMGALTSDPAEASKLAALFPEGLDVEGLPTGWNRGTVEDLLELAYGKSLPKSGRAFGTVPVYGSGGVTGTHAVSLVAGPGVIVGRKGTVGSLYWEPSAFFPIDTVFYVSPRTDVSLEYAWGLLQTLGLEGMNTDAAVPGLNRSNVYRLEVPLPDQRVISAYSEIAGHLRALQTSREAENRTLAETRDYLLPRLMSGAVRVESAEAV